MNEDRGGQTLNRAKVERNPRGYWKGWKSLYGKCGVHARREKMNLLKLEVEVACNRFWAARGMEEPGWNFRDNFNFTNHGL